MMKCAKCHISVQSFFSYCPNCGARLRKGFWPDRYLILFLFSLVLAAIAAGYVIFVKSGDQLFTASEEPRVNADYPKAKKVASAFDRVLLSAAKPDSPALRISAGTVVIYDIAGNPISRMAAAASESGWVAIPARLCIGGYSWYFVSGDGDELEFFGGILGDQDDVGLWQFKTTRKLSGPEIFPAKPAHPMTWMSVVSENSAEISGVSILSEQQNFYHISLAKAISEPGVLVQDQKIVGWAFGDLADGGYLWKGPDESNLVYELGVYDFYRQTFENSREEQFILAYSKEETDLVNQLELFAGGFRRNPVLFEENTPVHLKTGAVIAKMRSIISQVLREENFQTIASIFDSRVLSGAGDVSFLIDVLTFSNQVRSPEYSINVVENVLADPENFNESQIYQIRQFQKELYRKRLTQLMNEKNYSKGIEVYRRAADFFMDDPEIHLLGVKLALVFGDWETAEQIIKSKKFPIDMTDQVRRLEAQAAELKFQEDKIVVRFSPESGRIPVTGVLNNRLRQDFVIDTGASMVTIPGAAAKKLGIEINGATPVRDLVTAGGIIAAPQITINSIEIGGWTEYNVTAYVVDMPNQSGFGLLGLNYLNRFRMDLNTQSGVLTLAPR